MRKFLLIAWLFCGISAFGATYYSNGSNPANLTTSWNTQRDGSGSTLSSFTSSDIQLVIQNGHSMTTTGNRTYGDGTNPISSSITIENGGTLTATNRISIRDGSGTSSINGNFIIENGGTYIHNTTDNDIWSANMTLGNSSTIEFQDFSTSNPPNVSYGNVVVNLASRSADFEFELSSSSTIIINGDLSVSSTGGHQFGIANNGASAVTLNIGGNFLLTGGEFDFFADGSGTGGIINVEGNVLFTGGTWTNTGSDNLTINFVGTDLTSNLNLNGVSANAFTTNDITWQVEENHTLTLLSNINASNDQNFEVNGTLNFSTFYIEGGGSNGKFITTATATLGIGASDGIDNASSAGSLRYTSGDRDIDLGTNIIYNGTTAQETGDGLDDIGLLTSNIQISNTSNTVTFTEDLAVDDGFELIVDDGATLLMNSGIEIIKSSGDATLTINGTVEVEDDDGFSTSATSDAAFQGFTSCSFGSNGLANYIQSGSQTITNQFSYGSLTLSGTTNKTAAGALDIDGDLLITGSATFIPSSNQVNIGGSFTLNSSASLTESGSTLVFDGTGTHTISSTGTPENLDDVQFTSTGTYTLSSAFRVNSGHTLTISGACTINTGDNEFDSPSGNLVMSNGTFNFETVTATDDLPDFSGITISGGTIELGGSGAQELNGGETYNNLTFSGSGTKTISSATSDIDGTVYITESCTLNVSNSTFGDGSTNLTMDNGYFIVEGSSTRPNIGGTYSLTGGTIEFAGSSATSVRSPITYHNVVISGTNTSSSSGNYTLNDGATFTINSGAKFTTSNKEISSSGAANVVINGTFETEDADGFAGTSNDESIDLNTITLTLGSSSTIEYGRSGAQPIADRDDYANLTVSGSGIKTMSGTPTISGNYTISAGSVNYPTSITFGGSSTQTIAGNNYGTTTVILDGGGEKDIDADATFNGTITFTNGVLDLNNHDVNLGTSVTVSSANNSSYLKTGGTGRVVRTITSGSDFLFPIGENPYLPMTVSCASCTNEEISVGVEDVIYDDPEDETTTFATAGHTNYVNKTWDLTTNGISGNVTIELQWNSSDQTSNPGSNNSSNNIGLGYWEDGSSLDWNPGTITSANYSGTIYSQERTINGLNSSKYYLGIGANSSPLPVEFAYFNANCQKDDLIEFNWKTFSEINCSHFELQLSTDGINYNTVLECLGRGTTINPSFYQEYVKNDLGYQFARLKQVDFDEAFEYSKTIEINCENDERKFKIQGKRILLSQPTEVQILSLNGTLIQSINSNIYIDLSFLPSGVYLIKFNESVEKITIQ